MKQGEANSSMKGSTKPGTVIDKVNPAGVGQIGQALGPARAIEPIFMGKGPQAPMESEDCHHCGSQGKF